MQNAKQGLQTGGEMWTELKLYSQTSLRESEKKNNKNMQFTLYTLSMQLDPIILWIQCV